jgi:phosphohistidine phosphatase SixA
MDLFIVRHGIAFDMNENGILTDESRTLTPEGRRKVAKTASAMNALGIKPAPLSPPKYPNPRSRQSQTPSAHHLTHALS